MAENSKTKAFLGKALKGRPKPSAPRAGYKASGSRSERPAYISGDTAKALAEVICELGCR